MADDEERHEADHAGRDLGAAGHELHAEPLKSAGNERGGLATYANTLRRPFMAEVLSTRIWGVPPACLGSR